MAAHARVGFRALRINLGQLEQGAPVIAWACGREGRAPVRAGAPLFAVEDASAQIGSVTSGGLSQEFNAPIAMGYLPTVLAVPSTTVFAELRGKRVPVSVTRLPFIERRYKRG